MNLLFSGLLLILRYLTFITLHTVIVTRALAHAATELGKKVWCEGATITLADLALASALIYLDLRMPELNWGAQHGKLAARFARMSEGPSMRISLAE